MPPSPQPSQQLAAWPVWRIALWAVLTLGVVLWLGPAFVRSFRPRPDRYYDFFQEWSSARNYFAGLPVYSNLTEALQTHTGMQPEQAEAMLPWNAHPPCAVLVVLPLGPLDYRTAQTVWNLAMLPLLAGSLLLLVRHLGIPFACWSVLPLTVLLLTFHPLYTQVAQGQLNALLLVLVVGGWAAERSGRPLTAGVLLGLAAAIKLFPAFLFLPFLVWRRWRTLAGGALAFLLAHLAALLLFGTDAFATYVREVVPSVARYRSSWINTSAAGFWFRLFDPAPREKVIALWHAPWLATLATYLTDVVLVAVLVRLAWRATDREGRDRAFALAVTAMLLVCPITWSHYFLLLLLPVGLLWLRLPAGAGRAVFWGAVLVIWLPFHFFIALFMGSELPRLLADMHMLLPQATPGQSLAVLSLPFYALLTLCTLQVYEAWKRGTREAAAVLPSARLPGNASPLPVR